ncbi:MAG TPA: YceI family protein [Silvibacterium sp.]|nr:YceI family protein [Silvibacterium sp.]
MKSRLSPRCLLFAWVLIAPLLGVRAAPQSITMHLDPARTEIHWTLNGNTHTVHGTFRLKGGMITFDPSTGAAQGEMLVDVQTGESGNQSRDSRMKKEILESDKYPQAIFHPVKVTGVVKAGSTQNVTVEGTFTIHGVDHPLNLNVKVQVDGHDAVATTHFSVPYVDWGMKDPSTFIFRVDKTVDVDVIGKGGIEGVR